MALSLVDRYSSLSVSDCLKTPSRTTDEETLSVDPLCDMSLTSSTFVLPPGKEVSNYNDNNYLL